MSGESDARAERIRTAVAALLEAEGAPGQDGAGVPTSWILVAEWMMPDVPAGERWMTYTTPRHQSRAADCGLLHLALYESPGDG